MKFSTTKSNEKLIQLLKQSKQNFRFEQEQQKLRLMQSLEKAEMIQPVRILKNWHIMQYGIIMACLLLFVSGTFAFAANSTPGDQLFPINKLGEKIWLNLPWWSIGQKAKLEARIVTKRLTALEAVRPATGQTNIQITAKQMETVKEASISIKTAIETVTASKKISEAQGLTETAQQLGQTLTELDNLAQKNEEGMQVFENSMPEGSDRKTVCNHHDEIKNARHTARIELKLED